MASKKRWILVVVSILSVIFFLYISKPSDLFFLNDDNIYIPLSNSRHFLFNSSFRPISDISLFIDYFFWGTDPLGYHLSNLILHLTTVFVLFFFYKELLGKYSVAQSQNKAFVICFLFLFYPFHSEPLYWIIGRGGLIATFFGVCSLYFYLVRQRNKWFLFVSICFFFVGAFSYEAIWAVPFIITAIAFFDFKYYQYPRKRFLKDISIFWTCFGSYLVVRALTTGEIVGTPYGTATAINIDLLTVLKNYNALIARSFLPPMKSTNILLLCYFALLLIVIGSFLRLHLKGRLTIAARLIAICFLISFLPVISFGIDSHDTESERFLYFPSVFAILLVTELIFNLFNTRLIRYGLLASLLVMEIVLLAKSARTYQISSIIAARSINGVSKSKFNQVLYCMNLPTQYSGAFIFRIGFPEAVRWLTPDSAAKRVVILSTAEVDNPVLPYDFEEITSARFILTLKDKDRVSFQNLRDTARSKGFLPGRDVIFYWTDSTLIKVED
jgi:hypothetical protein